MRPATATTIRVSRPSADTLAGRVAQRAGVLAACALAGGLTSPALAHPEDDICGPDSGLDPALCRALSELESAPAGQAADALVSGAGEMGMAEALVAFFAEGWSHVLPGGLDHILFIAALFLSTSRLGSIASQLSAFTLAHTVTVGLSAAGLIAPPASVVEPLIAATIAAVAVETVVFREPPRWRLGLVFLFGLIHGMGFARAFSAASADGAVFWPGLVGFNLGVEAAQILCGLAVLALAWAVGRVFLPQTPEGTVRHRIKGPAGVLIGLAGLVWFVQALLG